MFFVPFLQGKLCFLFSSGFCCGSFFSRSFGSFCFCRCFSGSLGSFFSGFLFGQCFSFHFVYFLFGFQTCFGFSFLSFFVFSFQSGQTVLFVVLPSFELSFCFCFAECAFRYTAKKVLLHVNAFTGKDVADSVGRLCTFQHPVKCAVEFQIYCGRIGVRVVSTNLLNKFTIKA